ncbi:MAG TPA: metal-sensitive transcriptional regulator [Microbacteriaceae bacterium]|nr:metal-sensitive transcriptional regulator [Microbacteriaceae bacterium]
MNQKIDINLMQDEAETRKIINRLKRAQGQLGAVIKALEDNKPCLDVMQQLSAVSKAIDRAGFLVIAGTLRECLREDDSESIARAKEIEKMFLTLA